MDYTSTSKKRSDLLTRWGQLKSERASWWMHWKEISDYLLPRSGRFFVQDRNRGTKRHNLIYDNTATRSLRVCESGLMAGATSPARPWFRLATADPDLNKFYPVKLWLDDVTRRMQSVFARSNTYRALHQIYGELAAFGTAASLVMPDYENVTHHHPLTIGEYCIAADYKGRVDCLYREFEMTVAQMVKEFGIENCSSQVQEQWRRGNLDSWITVIHAIEPREDRDTSKLDDLNMPFRSCYFEIGGDNNSYLRESGFRRFPAVVPRWSTAGGDIYGMSPGMECLGDVKQLQHEQLRKAQAIDLQTKPPLQAPTSAKNRDIEMLPGGVSFVDSSGPNSGIRTAFEVNLNLSYLLQDIGDCRQRINSAFYADLFLMLANNANNPRMTATEVAERHEEKLLMLGPVLERLHNELLDPLIDITFEHMMQSGQIPPPPQELSGQDLSVEFVSMLAQAQRAIGTNSVDRFVGSLGVVAQMKPEVLDKFDPDVWADAYGDMLGVDPKLILATEDVVQIRQAREAAMAAKEQTAALEQQTKAMGNLRGTPMNAAASDVMGMFSGYNSPSPQML